MVDHLPGRAKDEETDVNVWDEPPDSEKNIVKVLDKHQKLEVQAGTLNKLIEQLVPDVDKPLGTKEFLLLVFFSIHLLLFTQISDILRFLYIRIRVLRHPKRSSR